jgi:hypothetical protein
MKNVMGLVIGSGVGIGVKFQGREGEIPEGRGRWPDRPPVLADRARSECARSMRAVGDRFKPPFN